MSATKFRDPAAEELLERIRNLKELLRAEELGTTVSPNSESPDPNSGENTPSATMPSQPRRQRHFSPPTRDSPIRSNSHEGPSTSANQELIEETWHLLTQVTYARVVIDRLTWIETPKILLDELKRPRVWRQKSFITMEYYFPTITSPDGSVSARDVGKRTVVPAKDVLSKVVHFNHRQVILLRMTQPLLQLWSQSCFTIKIFCDKKPTPIAKCNFPLCKLLVMPFSFDADVLLEPTSEHSKCSGKLKVCVQLGSRFQSFTDRVEPMRNPTTTPSEFTFIDPMKLVASVPPPPPSTVKPVSLNRSRSHLPTTNDDGKLSPERPVIEERITQSNERRPQAQAPALPSYVTPSRSQEPGANQRNAERKINETFLEESHDTPSPLFRHGQIPSSSNYENVENEPRWLRLLVANRGENAGSYSESTQSPRMAEPYVSNISVYGNRAAFPAVSTFGKHDLNDFQLGRATSACTGANVDERPIRPFDKKSDVAAQTSFVDTRKDTSPLKNDGKGASTRIGRRPTVAEKILKNRSSLSFDESHELLPPAFDAKRGFWLQVTIHRARTLPLIKEKSGSDFIKPTCFWTYCADSGTCYSPVAMDSCEPVWEWSHKMFIPPHRKTLVLKLWHRGKEGRDRVLGFVAILFPIEPPFDRVWYDIVDLTRASTGQMEISFAHTTEGDRDREETPPKVMAMTPPRPKTPDGNEEIGAIPTRIPEAADFNVGHEYTDTGVNTTLPNTPAKSNSGRRSSSPFIALTTRSFLTQELRKRMKELTALTSQLRQNLPSEGIRPKSESKPSSVNTETVTIEPVGSDADSPGASIWQEDVPETAAEEDTDMN